MNPDKIHLSYLKEIHCGRKRGIHLEITTKCLLKCPLCLRVSHPNMMKEAKATYGEMTIEDFKKIVSFGWSAITMCGNFSDPIYHSEFLKFLEIIELSEKINTAVIHTNGWGRKISWWEKAYKFTKIKWIFGLDGLPHQSHIYRRNQKGEEVWEVMKLGSKMGRKIIWQWIPFGYNEDFIEEGLQMAKDNNIEFLLRPSTRFYDPQENGRKIFYKNKGSVDDEYWDLLKPKSIFINKVGGSNKERIWLNTINK